MLVGNVGREPAFLEFTNPQGNLKGRYKFPLATFKTVKGSDGELTQKTTWHNITTLDPAAEAYIKTGYDY